MLRPKTPKQIVNLNPSLELKEDLSFGPAKRIKKRSSFLKVQGRGRKFKTKSLLLCFLRAEEGVEDTVAVNRLGITVTTKVHKRAVRRNRTKRIIREIFRSRYSELKKRGDLVVILLAGGVDRTYSELYEEFDFALNKLGLI